MQSKAKMSGLQNSSRAGKSSLVAAAVAVGIIGLVKAPSVQATSYTWDANGTSSGVTDAKGTWNTTSNNWFNGTSTVAWPNLATDTAVFGDGSGTTSTAIIVGIDASVGGGVNAGAITFDKTYSIGTAAVGTLNNGTDGTITLGGTGTITVNSGGNGTIINAALAGALTKEGTGDLKLIDNNVSLTSLTINAGRVIAGGLNGTVNNGLGNGGDNIARAYLGASNSTITVNPNGTLFLQSGGNPGPSYGGGTITLAGGTLQLANFGSITNLVDVTADSFLAPQNNTLSGGITGSGTLTWNASALNNRSTISGLLSGFTGTLNLGSAANVGLTLTGSALDASTVKFDLGTSNAELAVSIPSTNSVIQLGELSGGAQTFLSGHVNNSGFTNIYEIGALGTNSTFAGTIQNNSGNNANDYNTGNITAITKVNSAGSLTLSGNSTYKGATTVRAGTLVVGADTWSTTVSEASVTADSTSNDNFTLSGNTLANGNKVVFGIKSKGTGNVAPGGITLGTPYFVVGVSGNTFQVSDTLNGMPITMTSNGGNVVVSRYGALGAVNTAIQLGDSGTLANDTLSLMIGGPFTMARIVAVNNFGNGTTIGGSTDNSATFSGAITVNQDLTISQAATTGTNALNIAAGITTGSAGTKTLTFTGPGAINTSGIIANGTGTVAAAVSGGQVTLSAVNTYTGATTVTGGTLEISPTGSLATTSPVTVGGGAAPAALTIDSRSAAGIQPVTLAAVSIQDNGTVNVASPANPGSVANHPNRTVLVADSLSLSGSGSLDLGGNDLVVHNGNLTEITAALKSGFNQGSGYWNGVGIRSSAAAADSSFLTTLGTATDLSSFDGGSVSPADVLVKYTYYGDADLSGKVDGTDYSMIDVGFNSQTSGTSLSGWQNGDFNYDGKIDGSDYSLIDNAFNLQGSNGLAAPMNLIAADTSEIAGAAGAVPEPGSLMLLGMGAVGLLSRRRRK